MNTTSSGFATLALGIAMLAVICAGCSTETYNTKADNTRANDDRFGELAAQPFVENAATDAAARTLMEELYFQRACQAYLWALPAMNTVAMKEGSAKAFGSGYNVMPVWRKRLNPKTLVTTPNSDVIYAMGFLGLQLAPHAPGQVVVHSPASLWPGETLFRQLLEAG